METKNLTTESSLKIIAETMERSRMTIAKNLGKPLILWGALVALTSVVVYFLLLKTGNLGWNLLSFFMSIIGFVCTMLMDRNKEKAPETEVSRIIGKIWMWFGIFVTGFYALIWLAYLIIRYFDLGTSVSADLTLIIALAMGLCGVITGAVMRMKSVIVCLIVATAVSVVVALVVAGPTKILVFAVLGVLGLVVPGLILQGKVRNNQLAA